MKISFSDMDKHVISMEDFDYGWRFINNVLPQEHIKLLKPLNTDVSVFIWNYISDNGLHEDFPFKKDFFRSIQTINAKGEKKTWLDHLGIAPEKEVILSWQPGAAMIVPYQLLVEYRDDFYYPVSDDLTVLDGSLGWALLFHHTDDIYFGSNMIT